MYVTLASALGLLLFTTTALGASFSVREGSLVFVDPVVEPPSSPEAAEAGSDWAFYRDAAETFAKNNGLRVYKTRAGTLLFERLGAKPIRLKNTAGAGGDAYFFDGKTPPHKIESLATLDDGKEFQKYFGRPARGEIAGAAAAAPFSQP